MDYSVLTLFFAIPISGEEEWLCLWNEVKQRGAAAGTFAGLLYPGFELSLHCFS
jgi:hypothetical protein